MQSERSKKPRHRRSPATRANEYFQVPASARLPWSGMLEVRPGAPGKFQLLLNQVAKDHGCGGIEQRLQSGTS